MQDTPGTPGPGGPDPAAGGPSLHKEPAGTPPPPTPTPPYGHAGPVKPVTARARDIVVTPKTEWAVIDAEPSTVQSILTSYVLILAAIGPLAALIGQQIFGINFFTYRYTPPLGYSIVQAVMTYAVSIGALFVSAIVINALAPTFGARTDKVAAFKTAAYSATPSWLAGILLIVPALGMIAWIAGIYGIYLLYLGLKQVMKSPEDKAVAYTAVTILVYIGVFILLTLIVVSLLASMFMTAAMVPGRMGY